MSTAPTTVVRAANGQITAPPSWSCPCVRCPVCDARRGPVTLHPEDGEAKCFACDHEWSVAIGALPGIHADSADTYEIFQLVDADIDLAMCRQREHDEANMVSAAEGS